MAEEETEKCGHETADGTPCSNPATEGDNCWLAEHGGDSAPSGAPTRLTDELIDEIEELVADGTLVKDVWAWLDIPRRTWEAWRRKGKADLRENGEPTTMFGEFMWRLTRAEHKAREKWHRFVRDGLVKRKHLQPVKDPDTGEVVDVKVLPKRLDPETREEIPGEAPGVSNAMKYVKARWPDDFAEKHKVEHSADERVKSFLDRLRAAANGEDVKDVAVVPPDEDQA